MSFRIRILEIYNQLYSRYGDGVYNIGILPYKDNVLYSRNLSTIVWLQHSFTDRWFADPFLVEEDSDSYTLFVEAFFYKNRKGVIGRIKASKLDFTLLEYSTILELETHLSFPIYFKKNNEVFVYPENSRSGKLTLYRYDKNVDKLIPVKVLIDEPLTDAVMFLDGKYILGTTSDNPNGNICKVYQYDSNKDLYYYNSAIIMNEKIARGAGLPFSFRNEIIRPAQVCNNLYGEGISIQKFVEINEGHVLLCELNRYICYDKKYNVGFHTFNVNNNVIIVDGYYYPSKFGYCFFKWLRKILFNL